MPHAAVGPDIILPIETQESSYLIRWQSSREQARPDGLSSALSSVQHLCWVPGTHSQGIGVGGGGEWTKHKSWLILLTGPPQKSLVSVQNGISYFDFEIWHHISGQACTELVKSEEKKRGNEHLNMIYRLLP